ncbi:MAG: Wzt carbohydrate-binding domain-containing protein [Thermodesulforhabdaceae bacterium]
MSNNKRKLFFDHIPKAAGTSLQQFFVEAFGESEVTSTIRGQKLNSVLAMYGDLSVIAGHFGFVPGDSLPDGWVWATILRNPRERTLSEYFYILNDVPPTGCSDFERRIKMMSLEDALYDGEFASRIYNYQAVHFASFFHPTPAKLSSSELLHLAKQGLEQYHLVGTTERFAEFVDELKRIFNLPREAFLKRYNVTSSRKRFDELPGDIQRRIDELTSVDMELWEYANFLFETKTKRFELSGEVDKKSSPDDAKKDKTAVTQVVEDGSLELISVTVTGQFRNDLSFLPGERASLRIAFRALKDIDDLTIGYSIHHDSGLHIFGTNTRLMGRKLRVSAGGKYHVDFVFTVNLGIGQYFVNISAHSGLTHLENCYLWREKVACFGVAGFLDVPFEGLVRLMPSVYTGMLSLQGKIESENTSFEAVQRLGLDTPPIADAKGFIRLISGDSRIQARCGEQLAFVVEVMNKSNQTWITEGNRPVYLSYHVLRKNTEMVIFDGYRTPLPCKEIRPGDIVGATVMAEVPKEAGEYVLELTMVQEMVCWFEERGFDTEKVMVEVVSYE